MTYGPSSPIGWRLDNVNETVSTLHVCVAELFYVPGNDFMCLFRERKGDIYVQLGNSSILWDPDPCSVTSYSVPGAFLIIHGRRNNSMAFQLGGALVVSIPIVVGIIFCLILCLRRKSRKLTLNSSTHIWRQAPTATVCCADLRDEDSHHEFAAMVWRTHVTGFLCLQTLGFCRMKHWLTSTRIGQSQQKCWRLLSHTSLNVSADVSVLVGVLGYK